MVLDLFGFDMQRKYFLCCLYCFDLLVFGTAVLEVTDLWRVEKTRNARGSFFQGEFQAYLGALLRANMPLLMILSNIALFRGTTNLKLHYRTFL